MDFDPKKEGHVMVGAKSGMYDFQDGKFVKSYNMDNSKLTSALNNMNYTIVSSLKYDDSGDLWVLNSLIDNPILKYRQTDDSWEVSSTRKR